MINFQQIYQENNLTTSKLMPTNALELHLILLLLMCAKSLQPFPTLCNPMDWNPSGSSVQGILQARILEWVAISFSNTWKWKVKAKLLSRFWLLATPWTVAHQAPPSMGFSRQEYWSGVPLPSPTTKLQLPVSLPPWPPLFYFCV